jgi:hypothetical protein
MANASSVADPTACATFLPGFSLLYFRRANNWLSNALSLPPFGGEASAPLHNATLSRFIGFTPAPEPNMDERDAPPASLVRCMPRFLIWQRKEALQIAYKITPCLWFDNQAEDSGVLRRPSRIRASAGSRATEEG